MILKKSHPQREKVECPQRTLRTHSGFKDPDSPTDLQQMVEVEVEVEVEEEEEEEEEEEDLQWLREILTMAPS